MRNHARTSDPRQGRGLALGLLGVLVFALTLPMTLWTWPTAPVRVSQLQLLQPFLSMLFAMPLLGETLDVLTLAFGLAVIAVVFAGRKMPVGTARPRTHEKEGSTP